MRAALPAREPTWADRMVVHRTVEWMRAHDAWPDELDFQEDACEALAAIGVSPPAGEAARDLLVQEVAKAAERAWQSQVDAQWAQYLSTDGLDEESDLAAPASVDPYGELSGGRPGTQQLLCRRIDEASGFVGTGEAVLEGGG